MNGRAPGPRFQRAALKPKGKQAHTEAEGPPTNEQNLKPAAEGLGAALKPKGNQAHTEAEGPPAKGRNLKPAAEGLRKAGGAARWQDAGDLGFSSFQGHRGAKVLPLRDGQDRLGNRRTYKQLPTVI